MPLLQAMACLGCCSTGRLARIRPGRNPSRNFRRLDAVCGIVDALLRRCSSADAWRRDANETYIIEEAA